MIIICGHQRAGTSVLLKTFTLSGLKSGYGVKGRKSECPAFRHLTYDIAKKCGYSSLGGVEADKYRLGILYGHGKDWVDYNCPDIDLDVLKYPAAIFSVETLIRHPVWCDAKWIFTIRKRNDCADSIIRFVNSNEPPKIVRGLRHIINKKVALQIFDDTQRKIMQLKDKVDCIIWNHEDTINKRFERLEDFVGMKLDLGLINKELVH